MSYYGSDRLDSRSAGIGCLIVLVAALVLFGLSILIAPYYTTQFWWVIRESLFIWIPLMTVAVLVFITAMAFDDNPTAGVGAGLLTAAGFIGMIMFWCAHGYLEDQTYTPSIQVTTRPVSGLAVRSPFNVAEKQASADLGDTVGDIQTTMYLPDQRRFTTLIDQKGAISGYGTLLTQDIGDTGRNRHELCGFSPSASRRFGGLFSSSLARYINEHERFVNWDDGDIYGYCDHGHPIVVTPLKQQSGVFVVTERPAGLALYHGDTGELEIVTDPARIARIPGPTYPLSLAAYQREATQAMSGFWNYFWDRSGWELPNDLNEINSDNIGEYVLADTTGAPMYVTLLTPRGGNTSVAAISTTPARLNTVGELSPLTVHRTHWLSPQAIEQRIRANFGPVFTAQPGATIAELAPVSETDWVATIGLPQNMLYRVKGRGDLSTDLCLYGLDGRQIQCGPMTNINGYGPGAAIGQSQGTPVQGTPASSDLHVLSTPQLLDLINRANGELASRAGR